MFQIQFEKFLFFCDMLMFYGCLMWFLYWIIVVLMLWQFLGMGLKLVLGWQFIVLFFVGMYQKVGMVLFVLIVLCVVWVLMNCCNCFGYGSGVLGFVVMLGYLVLYVVMVLILVVVFLWVYGSECVFVFFGFQIFVLQILFIEWMVMFGDMIYGELGWIMLVLIVGYVLMVCLYEGMWCDGILCKMVGCGWV